MIPIPTPDILIFQGQFTNVPVILLNWDIPMMLSNWDVGDWGHQSDTAGTHTANCYFFLITRQRDAARLGCKQQPLTPENNPLRLPVGHCFDPANMPPRKATPKLRIISNN